MGSTMWDASFVHQQINVSCSPCPTRLEQGEDRDSKQANGRRGTVKLRICNGENEGNRREGRLC
jgi:hypothetical protein